MNKKEILKKYFELLEKKVNLLDVEDYPDPHTLVETANNQILKEYEEHQIKNNK